MPSQINDTKNVRFHGGTARMARFCVAIAAGACFFQLAFAKPGGEPLVLDTQTGIHSGVSGTVLQSGPLGGPGMVPMDMLPGSPQQAEPIVVSPYVEYSGGQSNAPATPPGGGGRAVVPRPHYR
ncbi:hypothetical protein AWB79_04724 [Caballeronia hypogeia]|uniref:Lipoprotein n=1 Tax=Caballeronia hypogeia TaxID=1777140 RepID=A0A158C4C9_9BURK|nr:hypothetical protein [Caballeronia hypogeia]SAK77178.1 hypothetical protein AWB79_04724 [Caballeronia hypogeia]